MYMGKKLQCMKNAVSTAHRRRSIFRSKSMLSVMVSIKGWVCHPKWMAMLYTVSLRSNLMITMVSDPMVSDSGGGSMHRDDFDPHHPLIPC